MGQNGHGLADRTMGFPQDAALDSSALQVCMEFIIFWKLCDFMFSLLAHAYSQPCREIIF